MVDQLLAPWIGLFGDLLPSLATLCIRVNRFETICGASETAIRGPLVPLACLDDILGDIHALRIYFPQQVLIEKFSLLGRLPVPLDRFRAVSRHVDSTVSPNPFRNLSAMPSSATASPLSGLPASG
jgi:hypothetical protein